MKTPKTTSFSKHAWLRILERVSLTIDDVALILDSDLAVNLGYQTGTRRLHRLFYSLPDRGYFVAIQDERNRVVITVLTLRIHETSAWRVSGYAMEQARELIEQWRERQSRRSPRIPDAQLPLAS
jgi:hypothetical protein